MKFFVLLATCLVLQLPVAVQSAEVEVQITGLKGNLHMLKGRGGNVLASVGDDGILLVDDDYGALALAYEVALEKLSGTRKAPRFVLNTHWHGDHTQGNQTLGHHTDIIAHENVRKRLNSRQEVKLFNMAHP